MKKINPHSPSLPNLLLVACPPLVALAKWGYLLLTSPSPIHAQVDLEQSFLLNQTESVASRFPSITNIISTILPNIFIVSGLILLFIGIGAGITLISSGDNPEAKEKGTAALKGAIIGFVIIFASYWIIQILEIITGVPILESSI